MKIVLTGGGTGGHFYPLIAVAQAVTTIANERNLVPPQLYYISDKPYDEQLLYENGIEFHAIPAGKLRRYASLKNLRDPFITLRGILKAIRLMWHIMPDVVFSKGGYASVPTVFAARVFNIPIFIHDSDAVPGRANLQAARFATRIATSYPEAATFFPKPEKVACVGNPIRTELMDTATQGAHEYLKLNSEVPTLLIMGGSQGSEAINNVVVGALPELLNVFQVIHQTGVEHYQSLTTIINVTLDKHPNKHRYHPYPYLNALALRMAAGVAALVVSRAGSGAVFEVANWEKPAILVPIPEHVSRDQRHNAFAYARAGGGVVIEQNNLTPHILIAEITRILSDEKVRTTLIEGARAFKRPQAARIIAEEIVHLALEHEK